VAQRAYDRIERFAAALPDADLDDVLAAFKEIQTAR
jgi:ribosomal protein L12E/L44/L45/RPP1/RPP2